MSYLVSASTRKELQRLIDQRPGDRGGVARGGPGSRQICHVLVTAESSGGVYAGIPQALIPETETWESYGEVLLIEANGRELIVGERYISIRYGYNESTSTWVFVTDNNFSLIDTGAIAGCGLVAESDGTLAIDIENLLGCHLTLDQGSGDECPRFAVDVASLAGCGLVAEDESGAPCPKLSIDKTEQDGTTFYVLNNLQNSECGILTYSVTPHTIKQNECGVVLGIEAGEPEYHEVDVCPDDSSSGSGNPYCPSIITDVACAGPDLAVTSQYLSAWDACGRPVMLSVSDYPCENIEIGECATVVTGVNCSDGLSVTTQYLSGVDVDGRPITIMVSEECPDVSSSGCDCSGTGEPGPQGPPGEPGASAYEVALANGYVGTESQWLASLVGATGATGPEGVAPTGAVIMWAASSLPTGYLDCNGAAVSRSTYSALFSVIGTTWGSGDGSTTFNVPDMRGRAPIGVGTGTGLTARSLAASGGSETHTLAESEMPAHTHSTGQALASGSGTAGYGLGSLPVTVTSGSTGGGGSHNNMQPFRGIYFIIKY